MNVYTLVNRQPHNFDVEFLAAKYVDLAQEMPRLLEQEGLRDGTQYGSTHKQSNLLLVEPKWWP